MRETGTVATYATRVEQWECDFNGHWNTRYYGAAFAQAARVAAALMSGRSPDAGDPQWHFRFHRELHSADSVLVRSAAVPEAIMAGTIVHLLEGAAGLSATALQSPASGGGLLPQIDQANLTSALPRGLARITSDWLHVGAAPHCQSPLGIPDTGMIGDGGQLTLDSVLAYTARGAHAFRETIGIGPSFTRATGIACLLAEMRATSFCGAAPDRHLRMHSRLVAVEGKAVCSAHLLETYDSVAVARVELCVLTVDTASRKAVPAPDFLHGLLTN